MESGAEILNYRINNSDHDVLTSNNSNMYSVQLKKKGPRFASILSVTRSVGADWPFTIFSSLIGRTARAAFQQFHVSLRWNDLICLITMFAFGILSVLQSHIRVTFVFEAESMELNYTVRENSFMSHSLPWIIAAV